MEKELVKVLLEEEVDFEEEAGKAGVVIQYKGCEGGCQYLKEGLRLVLILLNINKRW